MKRIIFKNLKVAFFVFATMFITTLIFSYKNISAEFVFQIAMMSGTTTILFALIMGIYQAFYIKKNGISLDDFDIKPTQHATFTVDKTLEEVKNILVHNIPNSANPFTFKYDNTQDVYKAKTKLTMRSWGEIIIVKLMQIDNCKVQLSVVSKSALKTTLIDFGKSSMNINTIKLTFGFKPQ